MTKKTLGVKWLLLAFGVIQTSFVSAHDQIEAFPDKTGEDSTNHYKRDEFKKNCVRVDLLGKSVLFGFAYDRIVYHKKFDIHANVGLFPIQLFDTRSHSFNAAIYYSSSNKKQWNYIAGIAYNYGISYSSEVYVTHYTRQF